MKDFREWLEKNRLQSPSYMLEHQMCPKMILKSGLEMSVQASAYHYCSPRESVRYTSYSAFEVGFPTEVVEELLPYAETPSDPTGSVYARVPAEVIQRVIDDHGGIV